MTSYELCKTGKVNVISILRKSHQIDRITQCVQLDKQPSSSINPFMTDTTLFFVVV